MAEQDPQHAIEPGDDELSVEELENVAGGLPDINTNACGSGGNCNCSSSG